MDPNLSHSSTIADPLLTTSPNSPSTPSYLDLDRQEPTAHFQRTMDNDDGTLLYPSPAKKSRVFKDDKDIFCWICHKEKSNISCSLCVRSFHLKCLPGNSLYSGQEGHGSANGDNSRWVCIECNAIQKAEEAKTRSEALKSLTLDEFGELLKYAVQTIKQSADVTFHQPVSETQFPEYKELIIHPMDFATIEKNIRTKMYGCTESLLADVKWILHNCHIFNNSNHPLTNNAKYFFKVAKNEMAEIEVCPNCFRNFYKYHDKWFVQPCQKPHALVWARLKGHPFWPAKVVRIAREKNEVDARFFGAHDRAWVPLDSCFEISEFYSWSKPAKGQKTKFETAMNELETHISKIKAMFPNKFKYAPPKTQFNINKLFICVDSDEEDDSDDKSDKPLVIEELDSIEDSREFEKPSQTKVNSAFNDDLSVNDTSNTSTTSDERFMCTSIRNQTKSDPKSISEQQCLSPKLSITIPPPKKAKIKIGKGFVKNPVKSNFKTASPIVAATSKDDCKQLRDELFALKKKLDFEQILHEEQLREVKHNHSIVIKEMRSAMEADKAKALKDAEEVHRKELDSVKRKQWCAFCLSESIYFCCWNTSYCSYNCQSKHWPKHMSECQQQQQQNQQKMVPPKTQSHLSNSNQQQ